MQEARKEKKKQLTNFDKVKAVLCPDAVDAEYLMNVVLTTRKKRAAAAEKAFGDASPCAFCWKHYVKPACSEMQCVTFHHFPLTICRSNILRWLALPVGSAIPREWAKNDDEEQSK